jgi:hypothetical protein
MDLYIRKLPTFDQIVPEWKWWTAPQGGRGIHDWFVQSCKEQDIDPSSLFVRPHTNAKVCPSQQHIWRHYLNKVGKKEGKAKWKAEKSLKILHPNPERQAKKDVVARLLITYPVDCIFSNVIESG